jgi:hypothetical protein
MPQVACAQRSYAREKVLGVEKRRWGSLTSVVSAADAMARLARRKPLFFRLFRSLSPG